LGYLSLPRPSEGWLIIFLPQFLLIFLCYLPQVAFKKGSPILWIVKSNFFVGHCLYSF